MMMTLFDRSMVRHCIIDKCGSCKKITTLPWKLGSDVRVCSVYLKPSAWWARGICPLHPSSKLTASNIAGASEAKVRAGQQKQKKKGD
jgi:hypothetical protein